MSDVTPLSVRISRAASALIYRYSERFGIGTNQLVNHVLMSALMEPDLMTPVIYRLRPDTNPVIDEVASRLEGSPDGTPQE